MRRPLMRATARRRSNSVLSGKAADRLHDHIPINLDIAEKLVAAGQAIARKNNSAVVVVVLDPQGLLVLESRMAAKT